MTLEVDVFGTTTIAMCVFFIGYAIVMRSNLLVPPGLPPALSLPASPAPLFLPRRPPPLRPRPPLHCCATTAFPSRSSAALLVPY